ERVYHSTLSAENRRGSHRLNAPLSALADHARTLRGQRGELAGRQQEKSVLYQSRDAALLRPGDCGSRGRSEDHAENGPRLQLLGIVRGIRLLRSRRESSTLGPLLQRKIRRLLEAVRRDLLRVLFRRPVGHVLSQLAVVR